MQNSADEEDFENVAMSEAQPEGSQQESDTSTWNPQHASAMELDEHSKVKPSSDDDGLAKDLAALDIAKDTGDIPAADLPQDSDQVPAPLFANRQHHQPQTASQSEPSSEEHQQPDQARNENSTTATASEQPNDQQQQAVHVIETEADGSPVVGDFLKINFIENRVVPTILEFFFRFPWNNFLHNVVYDIIQQVFNGSMTRGYNRNLAISLFSPPPVPNASSIKSPSQSATTSPRRTSGTQASIASRRTSGQSILNTTTPTTPITNAIIAGSARSLASQQSTRHPMRLGYMGHLTLIAEEVVKFTERQLPEYLGPTVVESVTDPAWISFVDNELTETRERDNAILGGVRPDLSGGRLGSLGVGAGLQSPGIPGSSALADAGLTNNAVASPGLDSLDLGTTGGQSYGAPTGTNSNLLPHATTDQGEENPEDRDRTAGRGVLEDDEQVGELRFDDVELSFQRATTGRVRGFFGSPGREP